MKVSRIILGILFILVIAATIFYWPKPRIWLAPVDETWTLLAVGDIQLSRECAIKIKQEGPLYPFEKIKDLTQSTNLTVGNLESPFFDGQANTDPNTMIFGAEKEALEGVKDAGFDVLNLANNHFSNQGREGMNTTFDVLAGNDIGYFGAGTNFTAARQAQIKEVKNFKVAFLGYTDPGVLPSDSAATNSTPGVAVMDVEQAKLDIAAAKSQADIIIVSMHAGYEYPPNPNKRQIEFAYAAIDAGADVVLGHHPHVVQAIEDYKGKKIFYSLGNFVFDQAWSNETKQGLVVRLTFDGKDLSKTDLVPIKIENWCQPRVLSEDDPEYQSILNRIQMASEKLN